MSRTTQLPRATLSGLTLTLLFAAVLFGTTTGQGGRPGPAEGAGAFEQVFTHVDGIGWDTAPADETV
ncbi:hypothetical protein AB0M42_26295 [Streptomyces sp. NPDC051784]|uniref:hypothetical protein n=1 Tax=Streptomyces sp. NPDC051784 TaxID=3155805 RepID=UPI003449A1B1